MKLLQTSLALMALIAMVMPCAHAEEHHHEMPGMELCATDHAECHSCSDEPCADSSGPAVMFAPVDVPAPRMQMFCQPHVERDFVPVVVPLPPMGLRLLQTVQLLI